MKNSLNVKLYSIKFFLTRTSRTKFHRQMLTFQYCQVFSVYTLHSYYLEEHLKSRER